MDSNGFTPIDGLGLLASYGYKPPAPPETAGPPMPTEEERKASVAADMLQRGNEAEPGRYEAVAPGDVERWQKDWRDKEGSSGFTGDAQRLVRMGGNSMLLGVREAVRSIPKVGPAIVDGLDAIDKWATGKDSATILKENVAYHEARLTPEMQAARKKDWITESKLPDGSTKYDLGPAWSDPRTYAAGLFESAVPTAASMIPGGVLARGAFLRAVAGGASKEVAAAAAARAALIGGAVSEGIISGGSTAQEVRDQINALPEDVLKTSEAYQDLLKSGKTPDEARKALADDRAVKGLLIAGAATAMFGGQGDRVLAKIIAEGVHGSIGKRILAGAARGAVAEGLLEELPQSIGEKVAENYAMRGADPRRELAAGVPNAAVGGLITGGLMGAGFGGVGGAASHAEGAPEAPAGPGRVDPSSTPQTPPPETPKGPLRAAMEYGLGKAEERGPTPPAPPAEPPMAVPPENLPGAGETVIVNAGGTSFPARIESYQGGEALVADAQTGELLQVPMSALSMPTPEQFGKTAVDDAMAGRNAPPATPPMEMRSEPTAGKTVSAETTVAGPPDAGKRVIVDGPDGKRVTGRVGGYVTDPVTGEQNALVQTDAGELQVPMSALAVSAMTKGQIDAEERKLNPPVKRETQAGPTFRQVGKANMEMPDELHARLYDLGKERASSARLLGKGQLDRDRTSIAEQNALADAFGLGSHELGQIADDYRYRVDKAARGSATSLPIKMHKVNDKLLERKRAESVRAAAKAEDAGAAQSQPDTASPATPQSVDTAAHEAATSPENNTPQPTAAQKEAGNYKKGHISLGGLDISIENPAGSSRSGTDKSGKAWSVEMKSHYGYIKGTIGRDKDHIDVFIKPGTETLDDSSPVYIINQVDPNDRKKFDEHKVMLGFSSLGEAKQAYLLNYSKGWKGLGTVAFDSLGMFKEWLKGSDTTIPYHPGSESKHSPNTKDWLAERAQTIADARGAGMTLLDTIDPSVEAMRGLHIFSIHDTREFGTVRSVSNRGDVIVDWGDAYSAKKNLAEPEGGSRFGRSWLAPTDLKDYAVDRQAKPSPEAPKTTTKAGGDAQKPAPATKTEPVKWFGARDRAETYMAKKKLGATHEIVEAAKGRFEVRPRAPSEMARGDRAKEPIAPAKEEPKGADASPAQLAPAGVFAKNTIFTADKVEAARARLRSKMTQLNSGIDPEVLIDGMTIAGAYIESGVRSFADYAKRMADDFGPKIKPFLLSFWEGARNYPGLDNAGMTSPEQSKALFDETIADGVHPESAPLLGETAKKPTTRKRKTGAAGDMVLTQDWGVDHIDGYSVTSDRETGNETKDAFLREAKNYLAAIAAALSERGYEPHADAKGKPGKPVSANEAGPAVSGDVTLTMRHPVNGVGIYVQIGDSSLRGMVPTTASGTAIMYRTATDKDRYGSSGQHSNRWAPVDLSASQLAEMLDAHALLYAKQHAIAPTVPDGAGDGKGVASSPETAPEKRDDRGPHADDAATGDGRTVAEDVSGNEAAGRTGPDAAGDRRTADGVAGQREGGTRRGREDAGQSSLWPDGAAATAEPRDGDQDARGSRAGRGDSGRERAGSATAAAPDRVSRNFRIQPGAIKRTGSWRDTAARNVDIVALVKKLEREGRNPTPGEAAMLTLFTGWGASEIANSIFPDRSGAFKPGWETLGERLKDALSEQEYAQAKRTTQYAHYTGENVINSIYAGLARMGFTGGRVLEPGMGIGLFNGLMPDAMARASTYTGIEYDTMTGTIAKQLYPDSNILIGDYTETPLPKDYFDLAIGNPPFSSTVISNDPEYKKHRFMLHDYFFAKTLDRVRPGGLLVFVTSKGTMDKANDVARRYLAARANLVGAIRLPQTAFKENAGTEVVTDIILLQKRGAGVEENGVAWKGLAEIDTPQGKTSINEYFASHPEMVLGTHALTGSMYRANTYTVEPKAGTSIDALLADAIGRLPASIYSASAARAETEAVAVERDYNPAIRKEGGLYVGQDGALMVVDGGSGVPMTSRLMSDGKSAPLKDKETAFLKDWVGVRDALKVAYRDQLTDGDWESSLAALRKTYDAFVKKHGRLREFTLIERDDGEGGIATTKRFKNDPLFRLDVEGVLAHALEKIDDVAGTITPDKALTERVLEKRRPPEIKTVQDALFVSLDGRGRLDLDHVAALAGMSRAEVIDTLGSEIYEAPNGEWQTSDEYLSGDVRQKLRDAKAAMALDKRFARNVEALIAVQPRPLGPSEITINLGQNWIDPAHVAKFAAEVMGEQFRVTYSDKIAKWNVAPNGSRSYGEYNTPKMSADDILSAVLNNREIKITEKDSEGRSHVDTTSTEGAMAVAAKMREAFRSWIWTDKARADELVAFYNDHFNNIAPRKFDGSHLTLPGVTSRLSLRPHQKRAIWRAVQQGDTYLAHAVGAGKTFSMIAIGMEERRLGLSKKPMYVVPNHMLAQFAREYLELYPAANIMVADEQNFHTQNRKRFVAQAALNDPDAIILTHSAFGRIGMSDAYTAGFISDQIEEWKDALADTEKSDRFTIKQIERQIEGLEKRLASRTGDKAKKDAVLTFEELGVDRLIVDEAHEFRKLDFATNQGRIKGIDPAGSQRAMDLNMKVQYLRGRNGKRALVMASGTPVTNTMGELFTVQRFFQPDQLVADGHSSFDAWANHYGAVASGFEQNAAGGYEIVARFAKFQNVPELMRRVRSFMDILTNSDLGALVKRPNVKGNGRNIVVTDVPDGYKEYQKSLQARITAIKMRKGKPQKGDDIILNVIADGRFSAIDMRFVDPRRPSDPKSKLNRVIDDVISVYRSTANATYSTDGVADPLKGSSILVFSDIGLGEQSAQSRGFAMRDWIEKRLVAAGISPEHIAFIRDYKSHAKKERLFADMREGKKRIMIGGKDMETGVNVQKRLRWLAHIDAPWFPSSVEQREGRIVRQGNQNAEVEIKAYATKGSYDSTMWGMNARKARFIEQAMNGDESVRSLEDVSEASAFEVASALASGDERYLKLAGLKADVERLERLAAAHHDDQRRLASSKHVFEMENDKDTALIAKLDDAIKARNPIRAGEFEAKIGGKVFDNRDEFSKALFKRFSDLAGKSTVPDDSGEKIGEIGGFPIMFHATDVLKNYFARADVDLPVRASEPLIAYPLDENLAISGIATRAANQVASLDRHKAQAEERIDMNTRRIAQIDARLGAAFPEQAALLEKFAEMANLQDELAKEKGAEAAAEAAEAAAATVEAEGAPKQSLRDAEKPVTTLAGDELGVSFAGPEDMPELRRAAQRWYRDNLLGTTTTTRDGLIVGFKNSGLKKSTYGGKGDLLLRSVPAIRAIVENGSVALREAGNRQGVSERIVLRAPVLFDGAVHNLAVTIQRAADGDWQYDLHHDRDAEGPGLIASSDASGGPAAKQSRQSALESTLGDLNLFEIDQDSKVRASAMRDELLLDPLGAVARRLIEAGRIKIIDDVPAGRDARAQGWTDADGTITLVSSNVPDGRAMAVLLHEAFHAGARPLLGDAAWDKLMTGLKPVFRQFEAGKGPARAFFDAARASVAAAGVQSEALALEEFAAYAIENAETAPRSLRLWVDQIVGHVKAWALRTFGTQIGAVSIGQLRSIAAAAMRDQAEHSRVGAAQPAEGRYSLAIPTAAEAAKQIKGKLTDLTPAMLAAVPLNYFSELKRPAMTAVDAYLGIKRAMDTYRGNKHEKADKIAQEWLSYSALGVGKDGKARAAALADLMHDSTLAGVDPSMEADEFGKDGPPEAYANLRRRYLAMPEKGRALFNTARETYKAQSIEMDSIILANVRRSMEIAAEQAQRAYLKEVERIQNSKTMSALDKAAALDEAKTARAASMQRSEWANKARMTRLRVAFESSRLQGPYFPLARFGRYFVAMKDVDGEVLSFQRFETAAAMNAAADETRAMASKKYPGARVEHGVIDDTASLRQAMDPRLVAEIETILGGASVDPAVMDSIWQRYLETLPEMSIRKRQIHRKGTAGFEGDALRVFSNHMFHSAHQMARMKYGLELQETLNKVGEQARLSDDPVRGSTLANELRKRHDWVMNPTGSQFASKVTSAMFIWYLAASPASAVVNLTQTAIVGLPVLGARLGGIGKASIAVMRAAGDFISGKGDARKSSTLSADDKSALDAFYESGLIERTRSHDLAGVGNTGTEYSPLRARIMEKASWMFHMAEVFNREVTALAAYRMARAAGESHENAINTAHDLTWKTHFDYSNSNRPRIMQSDAAKVALVFQNFQINMWYRFFRDLHQSLKGETPQARREARYQIAGIMGMLTLLGGVSATFGFKALMMLAGMFFDDKDDPREFEEEMRGHIMKLFGPDIGAMIVKGVPGTLLNVDLTSRVGMADFLVRTRDSNKEGRDAGLEWLAALFGASASTVLNGFDGVKLITEGKVARGVEAMAPKAIRDLMQAYRFADDGLESRRGNTILERDKITSWDIGAKAIGFTSGRIAETYERSRELGSAERRVLDERKRLIAAWATARMHEDDDARKKAMEMIAEFNARPYSRGLRITSESLMASLRVRRRNDDKREEGVLIENKRLNRFLRDSMPERTFQ